MPSRLLGVGRRHGAPADEARAGAGRREREGDGSAAGCHPNFPGSSQTRLQGGGSPSSGHLGESRDVSRRAVAGRPCGVYRKFLKAPFPPCRREPAVAFPCRASFPGPARRQTEGGPGPSAATRRYPPASARPESSPDRAAGVVDAGSRGVSTGIIASSWPRKKSRWPPATPPPLDRPSASACTGHSAGGEPQPVWSCPSPVHLERNRRRTKLAHRGLVAGRGTRTELSPVQEVTRPRKHLTGRRIRPSRMPSDGRSRSRDTSQIPRKRTFVGPSGLLGPDSELSFRGPAALASTCAPEVAGPRNLLSVHVRPAAAARTGRSVAQPLDRAGSGASRQATSERRVDFSVARRVLRNRKAQRGAPSK
jgi:hypothetical protein